MTTNTQSKVLIVDDIQINIKLVESMLIGYPFNILKAQSGQEAIQLVHEQKPSVMILDLMMPGMSGFDVITELRKKYSAAHLPIIVMSALTAPEHINRAISLGATDYLTKPCTRANVVSAVLKAIGG